MREMAGYQDNEQVAKRNKGRGPNSPNIQAVSDGFQ